MMEKPFGTELKSAVALNCGLHSKRFAPRSRQKHLDIAERLGRANVARQMSH